MKTSEIRASEGASVRIAVCGPVKGTFFYAVPAALISEAKVGCRALVPFRGRTGVGYILSRESPTDEHPLKNILKVMDPEPLFPEKLVLFFQWMAGYYFHPIGRLIQSLVPGGSGLGTKGRAQWTELGEESLLKRPPGPLLRKFIRPVKGLALSQVLDQEGHRIKPDKDLPFLQSVFESGSVLSSAIEAQFKAGQYLMRKWIRHGVVEAFSGAVYRNPLGEIIAPSPVPDTLSGHQVTALGRIKACLDGGDFAAFLLHGVTGSGKTEVYLRAAEHTVASGRQVMLLVPEIALAIYMEGLLRSRWGKRLAIYHSRLSQGERYDQWIQMLKGEVDVVVGARSALFAPMPRLGLIIVDEEHDSAYKQDNSPRYQARDAAIVRARFEKAVVLLGSGTPSVQSYHNSLKGKYSLLLMPERVENRPLPEVRIVDMKAFQKLRGKDEMISPDLRDALEKNLGRGDQAILFLNRRGYHRLFLCHRCGQSLRCPNCDVGLTYHRDLDQLLCHYCGFHGPIPVKCPSCGKAGLKAYGFGTQKLEEELHSLFPDARIDRLDTDSVGRKGQAFQVLKRFWDQETDILVGTQMITKGYDFPGVTVVGVIAADLSLGFPDFRAGERTFQLLSQVAGRSGRGDRKGIVIVQTFNPGHYAIEASTAHDYHAFFEREKGLRERLRYPPFSFLCGLRIQGNDATRTEKAAQGLAEVLCRIMDGWPEGERKVQILGPAEAPLSRLKGKYRWQILIKSPTVSLRQRLLTQMEPLSKGLLRSNGVTLAVDVDPYSML